MKFTTLIQDMDGKEYCFEGTVVGKGMYDDNGEKSGFVIEDFNIVDISVCDKEVKFLDIENLNQMPDRFSEREIRNLKQDARDAFLNDWMDVQASADDASYDLFVSLNLQNKPNLN